MADLYEVVAYMKDDDMTFEVRRVAKGYEIILDDGFDIESMTLSPVKMAGLVGTLCGYLESEDG